MEPKQLPVDQVLRERRDWAMSLAWGIGVAIALWALMVLADTPVQDRWVPAYLGLVGGLGMAAARRRRSGAT